MFHSLTSLFGKLLVTSEDINLYSPFWSHQRSVYYLYNFLTIISTLITTFITKHIYYFYPTYLIKTLQLHYNQPFVLYSKNV